ncbi:cell wall metabolism sensor histidine kinase WalK [Paenibacillus sp. 1_12]|uniref:sensor histidine kinase n=1 Tax=Paenibacillus sp. 1_12 TaxID=1566278 RepID=UPI00210F0515|nr:sensor histidine kinase [Paenibacillus sp. 1_12]
MRDWNFGSNGIAALNGQWEFYWAQLLIPAQIADMQDQERPRHWIGLPQAWNGQEIDGERISGMGYATFHLQVQLAPSSRVLAVELPMIRTAYRMWINGQFVANGGRVGQDRDTSVPVNYPQLVLFPQAGAEKLDIVMQVSNFDHRYGGIENELLLGEAKQMVSHHDWLMGVDMLLVGSLLLMGFYNLGLFLIRMKEKSPLYLGLFCLLVGVRAMLVGEGAMFKLFPRLNWVTSIRMEYVCFYLGTAAALVFCYSLYRKETSRTIVQITLFSCAVFTAATLLAPPWIFTSMLMIYQWLNAAVCVSLIITLMRAFAAKREGALLILSGVIIYMILAAIDAAEYDRWIGFRGLSPWGLFCVIFLASFVISMKSVQAFASVETLSRELRDLNMRLEYRIKERTTELEQSNLTLAKTNEDLARLETSRRHLLSNISHDLGTPMTLIQGYVEALIDRVVVGTEQQDKYLKLILSRIMGLNRLIADLFQLSKLEARQIDFYMQELTIKQFIAYFSERYVVEVHNAGLQFEFLPSTTAPPEDSDKAMMIDMNRMDQVFTNLVHNAIKHTSAGGLIQVLLQEDERTLMIKVQDTGSGIEPDDLPYVFDRFYKKDKSRNSAAGGSGLGLAIAKEIVEFHGGSIWAESLSGQGALICLELPLKEAAPKDTQSLGNPS